jgi:hypothetical protein
VGGCFAATLSEGRLMPHVTGVYIAIPAYNRQTTADITQSVFWTGQLLVMEGLPCDLKSMGCADVEDLRNLLLTKWYYERPELSHLLMADADMRFSPTMIWDMICFDKPVTGCLYSRREFPISVVGKCFNDTDTIDNTENGFLKVEGVGGGVLLIKRSVIDKMIQKFPDLIDKATMSPVAGMVKQFGLPHLLRFFKKEEFPDGGRLSEDLSFCWRWRQCGGEIWANIKHPVGHVGPHDWTIRYEDYLERKKAEQDAAVTADVAAKVTELAEEGPALKLVASDKTEAA